MWKLNEKTGQEILQWKYGKVTIAKQEVVASLNKSILITTQPFEGEIVIPSDQSEKNMKTVDNLMKTMLQKNANRQTTVYIKGGGCLLDLAGFACSIYMRGVKKVIYIPTTVLAIVDATVGGKNGINWSGYKNLVGIIKHPEEIIIHLNYLYSLEKRDFANGLAEVIKMAITHDKQLFQLLQSDEVALQKIINPQYKQMLHHIMKRCLEIKIQVVEGDQYDRSSRKWLNFGHTIGHSLQLLPEADNLKHGECVAIGIMEELKLANDIGELKDTKILKRVERMLKKFELPTKIPDNVNKSEMVKAMMKDKKNIVSNQIQFTMIDDFGKRKSETTSIASEKIHSFYSKAIKISIKNIQSFNRKAQDINQKWNHKFPSSKSLSIRYLFLAALYFLKTRKPIKISNFLASEDTEHLKSSLEGLGFVFEQNFDDKTIEIIHYDKKKQGELNVGNSGLTARFILPLCGYLPGKWTLNCHKRMSERPNEEIILFCSKVYDCQFNFLQNKNCFPLQVDSQGLKRDFNSQFQMKSEKSSQFISSIILNSCLFEKQIIIQTNKNRVSESYIQMTSSCLQFFGFDILISEDAIKINSKNSFKKQIKNCTIEKDLSSLSYPYAFGLVHGIQLPELPESSVQGDIQFYKYCQNFVNEKRENYELDFNNCTDTFMTFSVLMASGFFKNKYQIPSLSSISIKNIDNQRIKESDRIEMIRKNLQKIGINVGENFNHSQSPIQGNLVIPFINPNFQLISSLKQVVFETAGDHRIAMSMAILSTYLSKHCPETEFIIDDKTAVNKTFPLFWDYLRDAGVHISDEINFKNIEQKQYDRDSNTFKNQKTVLIGNRGCGKTSYGKLLSQKSKSLFVDVDDEITQYLKSYENYTSIADYINEKGWDSFRTIEQFVFQGIMSGYSPFFKEEWRDKHLVIGTGGGIVEEERNRKRLKNYSETMPIIYLEKQFEDLQIEHNEKRPPLDNFKERSQKRETFYENCSNYILTIPHSFDEKGGKRSISYPEHEKFIFSEYKRIIDNTPLMSLNPGYILCWKMLMTHENENGEDFVSYDEKNFNQKSELHYSVIPQKQKEEIQAIELRVDEMMHYMPLMSDKELRFHLAKLKIANSNFQNLPLILTLRSKQQYGRFEGNYMEKMRALRKIPTNYLDYEIKHQINFRYDFQKMIHSYHGHQTNFINLLFNKFKGNKKLCFDGDRLKTDEFNKMKNNLDICYDLNNPVTRLSNRHKMVLPSKLHSRNTGTGIGTISQMKLLHKLLHLFR